MLQIANFSPFLMILFALGSLILAYILKFTYKILIRPQLKMRFYKKQGIPSYYFPLIGRYIYQANGIKEHGDAEYYSKMKARQSPSRAFSSNVGFDSSIVLRDPALVKEFCLNPENYYKDPIFLELYEPLLGKGLLTSEGSRWKAQRKTLSSAFHFEFLKSNLPVTQATTHDILYNLRSTSLTDVNIMDVFQSITGEVVGKIFFGEQLNQFQLDGKPLTLALADLLIQIGKLNTSPERFILGSWFIKQGFLPRHKKLMNKAYAFRDICRKIIEERKKFYYSQKPEERKKGMLELLLEYSSEEGKMSEEEVIDQFSTFFLAGMDTTGHLVTIAVYYLHLYPEMKEKMTNEVRQHYKVGQDVTIDDLNKLEYTVAFLKEILRVMTPVPGVLPRRAVKDHMVKDIAIRKDDLVELEFFYNNFNEQYFGEPDKFDPTRWFEKEKSLEAYAFTPFLGGPRNCIGQHLAMIESRIILAELLTMYDFKLKEGYEFKMEFKFLYEPVNPILLNLTLKERE